MSEWGEETYANPPRWCRDYAGLKSEGYSGPCFPDGREATIVKVTVSETCSGIAYNDQELTSKVTQLLTTQATEKLGSGYSMLENPQITVASAITSNRVGFVPRLVNGRTLKAMNQWYNKRMKELTLCLPKAERERVTRQMEQITTKRNRQVNHYLHAASKGIIDFLVKEGVGTIIVGKNPLWKQEAGMGRRNNQNFVTIPHARFIDMLTYKATLVGIQVEVQEESYTSKASFLNLDPIPTYKPDDEEEHSFSGKRIGRRNRLYRTKDGRVICADVNGSYNILRKRKPDAFAHVDAKGIAA